MGVAQLIEVERSLPAPEVRGSNPVISEFLYRIFIDLLSTVYKRQKVKKRGREWSILNIFGRKSEEPRSGHKLIRCDRIWQFLKVFVAIFYEKQHKYLLTYRAILNIKKHSHIWYSADQEIYFVNGSSYLGNYFN